MAYNIVNARRSKSVITVTGNTPTRINLTALSTEPTASPAGEIVTSASITTAISTTDGIWTVYRGNDDTGVIVLQLVGNNFLPLTQGDIAISNTSTANIYVTNSGTAGTLILQVSKTADYPTPLEF
jgi:hypothetical protein